MRPLAGIPPPHRLCGKGKKNKKTNTALTIVFYGIIVLLALLAIVPLTISFTVVRSNTASPADIPHSQSVGISNERKATTGTLFSTAPWKALRAIDTHVPSLANQWVRLLNDPLKEYRILVTCCSSDTALTRLDLDGPRTLTVTRFMLEPTPLSRVKKKHNLASWQVPDIHPHDAAQYEQYMAAGDLQEKDRYLVFSSNGKYTVVQPARASQEDLKAAFVVQQPNLQVLQDALNARMTGGRRLRDASEAEGQDNGEQDEEGQGEDQEMTIENDTEGEEGGVEGAASVHDAALLQEVEQPRSLKTSLKRLWRVIGGCGDSATPTLGQLPVEGIGWWDSPLSSPRQSKQAAAEGDEAAPYSAVPGFRGGYRLPPLHAKPEWALFSPVFQTMGRYNAVVDRALTWMDKEARRVYARYLISLLSPHSRILIEVLTSTQEIRQTCPLLPESVSSRDLRTLFPTFTVTFLESTNIPNPPGVANGALTRNLYLLVGKAEFPTYRSRWRPRTFGLYPLYQAQDLSARESDLMEDDTTPALPPTERFKVVLQSYFDIDEVEPNHGSPVEEYGLWSTVSSDGASDSALLDAVLTKRADATKQEGIADTKPRRGPALPASTYLWVSGGTANVLRHESEQSGLDLLDGYKETHGDAAEPSDRRRVLAYVDEEGHGE